LKESAVRLTINGAGKQRAEELREAALYFSEILLGSRLMKNISLTIHVKSKLGSMGYCWCSDNFRNPRNFLIELQKNNERPDDLVSTLAHELVHLKQYARNELGNTYQIVAKKSEATKWKGSLWIAGPKECQYYDSPWEIEAYGREIGLYRRWKSYKKLQKDTKCNKVK
jgi:hypothetical protein